MEVEFVSDDNYERPYDSTWDMYYDEFEDVEETEIENVILS